MGIFDDLKKLVNDMAGVERVGFSDEEDNSREPNIPIEYKDFPRFGKYTRKVRKKDTSKYTRCTMNFKNVSEVEISSYIDKIKMAGYVQGSKVRFDKGNTYIIVDYKETYDELELVFHIKR